MGETQARTAPREAVLSETMETVAGFVRDGLVPGVAMAWRTGGGPIRYHAVGELGFQSGKAVDDRSIFRIYSMTKPVTGIAAMMLVEDGALGLDQPLGEILPDFAAMRVVTADDPAESRPARNPITIRHLLTHTAGFGSAGMTLGALYLKHGIAPGTRERVPGPGDLPTPRTLAEMGSRLAGLPLAAEPGTRFDYSVSLDVLGLVVETVAGVGFDAFLQQRLFGPLSMVDTGFSVRPDQIERFADLPEQKGPLWTLADDPRHSRYSRPYYPSGGGGLVSTAHDYARFAAMLLNEGELDGVRVLKPETVGLARSNLLPDTVATVELPIGEPLPGAGFGAGMSVQVGPWQQTDGLFAWPGDVPTGVFGWPGAAGTAAWMDPQSGFLLVFLTQFWPSWLNSGMRPDVIAAAYRDLARQS